MFSYRNSGDHNANITFFFENARLKSGEKNITINVLGLARPQRNLFLPWRRLKLGKKTNIRIQMDQILAQWQGHAGFSSEAVFFFS